MAKQTAQETTHVRVSVKQRDRAAKVARLLSAREDRDVYYSVLLGEIIDKGLAKHERELGIA